MEIEWDNPVIWGLSIFATLLMAVFLFKTASTTGWDKIALPQRILITGLTLPVSFFIAQLVNSRG